MTKKALKGIFMNQDSIKVPVLHLIMNLSSFNLEHALHLFFFLSMTFTFKKTKPGVSQDVPLLHLSNCFLMAQVKFLFHHCICYELKASSKDLVRFLARNPG